MTLTEAITVIAIAVVASGAVCAALLAWVARWIIAELDAELPSRRTRKGEG